MMSSEMLLLLIMARPLLSLSELALALPCTVLGLPRTCGLWTEGRFLLDSAHQVFLSQCLVRSCPRGLERTWDFLRWMGAICGLHSSVAKHTLAPGGLLVPTLLYLSRSSATLLHRIEPSCTL